TIAVVPAGRSSYQDEGLTDGLTYQYRVRANGAMAASPFTSVAEVTAEGEPAPPPPAPHPVMDGFAGGSLDLDSWELVAQPGVTIVDNRLELLTTPGVNEHTFARYRLPRSFVGSTFNAEISRFAGGTS